MAEDKNRWSLLRARREPTDGQAAYAEQRRREQALEQRRTADRQVDARYR